MYKRVTLLKFVECCSTLTTSRFIFSPALNGTNETYYETFQIRSFGELKADFEAFKACKEVWKLLIKKYRDRLRNDLKRSSPTLLRSNLLNNYQEVMFPSPRLLNLIMYLNLKKYFKSEEDWEMLVEWTKKFVDNFNSLIDSLESLVD